MYYEHSKRLIENISDQGVGIIFVPVIWSWSWSHSFWRFIYCCNQWQYIRKFWIRFPPVIKKKIHYCLYRSFEFNSRMYESFEFDSRLCSIQRFMKKFCSWPADGRSFSPDSEVSSTNTSDRLDITEWSEVVTGRGSQYKWNLIVKI